MATATHKLGLDQKVIGAGLFNQQSNKAEQKSILEEILKNDANREDDPDVHNAKEINKRIARSEEEYALFKSMDAEREAERERRRAAGQVVLPPMVTEAELPQWLTNPETITVDVANAKFKDIEGLASNSFGRGKRQKKEVAYNDRLDDEEFAILMDRGATPEDIQKYIAERDARLGTAGTGADADEDEAQPDAEVPPPSGDRKRRASRGKGKGRAAEAGDEIGGGGGEDDGQGDEGTRSTRRAPELSAEEAAILAKAEQLLAVLEALADKHGRRLAESWQRVLAATAGKRGRSAMPVDLAEIGARARRGHYTRMAQVVQDMDRFFAAVHEQAQGDPVIMADAREAQRVVHVCNIALQRGEALGTIVAYDSDRLRNPTEAAVPPLPVADPVPPTEPPPVPPPVPPAEPSAKKLKILLKRPE